YQRVPFGNETLVFCRAESYIKRESREYMAKGCHVFLAQISATREDDKPEGKQVKDVPIVQDFPKVFPENLPGLPPARLVEFPIDLIPGVAHVAQAPYRLAPSKMKELSEQLQEFSEKGVSQNGKVTYKLELPQELSRVHRTFHVSNVKKCYSDEPLVMPLEGVHIDDTLQFVEEAVEIMEREVKRLKRSRIPSVKDVVIYYKVLSFKDKALLTGGDCTISDFHILYDSLMMMIYFGPIRVYF
nr:reverse transcriptase domain-containing protein [Tanacetum cinerariifolium]